MSNRLFQRVVRDDNYHMKSILGVLLFCFIFVLYSCSEQTEIVNLIDSRITDTTFNALCNEKDIDSFKIFILDTKEDEIVFSKVFEGDKLGFVSSKTTFENNEEPGGLLKPFWAAVLIEKAGFALSDKMEYSPTIKIYDLEIKDRFDLKVDSLDLFKAIVYASNTSIIGFVNRGLGNSEVQKILEVLQPKLMKSGVSSAYAALGYNVKYNTEKLMHFYGAIADKKVHSDFSISTLSKIDTMLANSVRVGVCHSIYNYKRPIHGVSATTPRFSDGIIFDSRFIGFENLNRRFLVYVQVSGREIAYGSQLSAKIALKVLEQVKFPD